MMKHTKTGLKQTATRAFIVALGIAAGVGTSSADAAILVHESFDYPAGAAATNSFNGGIGWDGAWYGVAGQSDSMLIAPGLTFGDLAVSGNARGGHSADS